MEDKNFNILNKTISNIDLNNLDYDGLNKIFQFTISVCEEKTKQLSQSDLEEQDLLHYLEFERLSACQISKIAKKIKEVRNARRKIKEQIEICSNTKIFVKALRNSKTKVYSTKVISLEDALK